MDTASSVRPRVALDPNANLVVVWQDARFGNDEILWQRFDQAGTPLTAVVRVTNTAAASRLPDVSVDPGGISHIAWQEGENVNSVGTVFFCRLDAAGTKILNDVQVPVTNCGHPQVAALADGSTDLTYFRSSGVIDFYTLYRRYSAAGTLVCSKQLGSSSTATVLSPTTASNSAGTAFVFWLEIPSSSYQVRSASVASCGTPSITAIAGATSTTRTTTAIGGSFLFRMFDAGGNIQNVLGSNNVCQISQGSGQASTPSVGADANDGYVVWRDNRDGGTGEIYFARFWSCTNRSGDTRLTNDPAASVEPDIAVDPSGNGNWVAVWRDARDGNNEIYMTSGGPPRGPLVVAPVMETTREEVLLTFTVTASDPDGDAIASLTATGTAINAGASFSTEATNVSGTFSWTPTFGQAGDYLATFTASNALSGTATTTIQVTPSLAITATAGPGGTINPNGTVPVTNGQDQTFTIAPSANYSILDVLVDGVSAGPVSSYTFTNVVTDHTIAASFATTITGAITGTIWQRPYEPPTESEIPSVLAQAWRGETAITAPVYALLDGTYSMTATLLPSDSVRVSARNEWLEVLDPGGNATRARSVGEGPTLDFQWTPLGSFSGDALNAYFIANDFGTHFWATRMLLAPSEYEIRVNVLAAGKLASTGVASSGHPVSSFEPGLAVFKDAVCHEFVHGMIFQRMGHMLSQVDLSHPIDENSEAKGLDEGLADYFTYAFTESPDFGAGVQGAHRPLNQTPPVKLPWCLDKYADRQKGYRAAPAISGALYDLRVALLVGQPGAPTKSEYDQWIFNAVYAMRDMPIADRTSLQLRQLLATAPLSGSIRTEVGPAFDAHNIKEPHDTTPLSCAQLIVTNVSRFVTNVSQTITVTWKAVSDALSYRVYLQHSEAGAGLGPGSLVGDSLMDTSFVYTDPDTTARIILTVIPLDSSGSEGNPSPPLDTRKLGVLTGVEDLPSAPPRAHLKAWPNPFTTTVFLSAAVAEGGRSTLSIFDVNGRLVKLIRPEPASNVILGDWDGRDAMGRRASAGIYFIRLTGERSVLERKVLLLR